MKIKEYSPGKVILFGEHFAIYGAPAIAAAIDKGIFVTLKNSKDNFHHIKSGLGEFCFERNLKDYQNSSEYGWTLPTVELLKKFQKENNCEIPCLEILIESEIPKGCGSGSAMASALTKALFRLQKIELTNKKHIEYIDYSDKVAHGGKTSMLDAYTVVNGGVVFLHNRNFHNILLQNNIELIICDSGIKSSTDEQISKLEKIKERHPEDFKKYFLDVTDIVCKAVDSMKGGDKTSLGELMYSNDEVLQKAGLSCHELYEIIEISKNRGEYGAKLTGAGGGGASIILPKNPEECLDFLLSKGYNAFITNLKC